MKQDYMKPAGRVVTLSLQENIAASGGGIPGGPGGGTIGGGGGVAGELPTNIYGVIYRGEGDTIYISNSSFSASSTGSGTFDHFYDLVTSYVYDLTSVCKA